MTERPAVSVLMMTFRHEAYVEQALRSVLGQVTSFPVEVLVADDASPDGTQAVVRALAQEFPAVLRPVLRARNIGAHENFTDAWSRCSGRYVALLEGDDFWVSPDKLQRQVDLMDADPGLALSFHDVVAVDGRGEPRPEHWPTRPPPYDLAALARDNFVQTCSVLYRAGVLPAYPGWMSRVSIGDWPLHLLHAQHGRIAHVPGLTAAYRMHEGGSWSGRPWAERLLLSAEALDVVRAHGITAPALAADLRATSRRMRRAAVSDLLARRDLRAAAGAALSLLRGSPA